MKPLKLILLVALLFSIGFGQPAFASSDSSSADEEAINEKFGLPIVVYGESLSEAQKEEVRKLLGVTDTSKVTEVTVTGDDLVTYIDGDKNSNLYSSAKITRKEKGEGLKINQVTPENITEVTTEMYSNALLTAGIEDAVVDVASPVKVTGHSALVGIYKAYDEGEGTELNKERTEVANEELTLATELAKQEGLDQDKVSELLTEIKKEMASQNPATTEELEKLIDEKLQSLNIELSAEDRQLLIDLFDKMRNLNINFDNVQTQLDDLSKDIQNRLEEAITENQGFLDSIANFFKNFIDTLKNLFS